MKWIRSITPKNYLQKSVHVGIGDDAAIFSTDENMENVITVDTMVEGVHFTKELMSPFMIGQKALAINISDMAAMGAIPQYFLVSIAIPKVGWNNDELKQLYEGMYHLGKKWGMDLIGGDTVSIDRKLVITVTVIGSVEKGRRLLRCNARPNDVVFVTGKLGSAAYSLDQILKNSDHLLEKRDRDKLKTYLNPIPQVEAGRLLSKSGYRISLNDISDGLASEAKEIAEASNVSIIIEWERIPKESFIMNAPIEKQKEWILYGGEDFQLVGTISPSHFDKLQHIFQENNIPFVNIGTVGEESGKVFLKEGNSCKQLVRTGYDHLTTEEKE